MLISDVFSIEDEVSGLRISVHKGLLLNRLSIERVREGTVRKRDFFFKKDGEFDGTGACVDPVCEEGKAV